MAGRRKQDGLKKVLEKIDAGQLYTQLNPEQLLGFCLRLTYNQGHGVNMETQSVSLRPFKPKDQLAIRPLCSSLWICNEHRVFRVKLANSRQKHYKRNHAPHHISKQDVIKTHQSTKTIPWFMAGSLVFFQPGS